MLSIQHLFFETYLATIKNSRGAKSYRDSLALVDGKKRSITAHGELSCAFFVSSLLRSFGLIRELHTTVSGTVHDLTKSGWVTIKTPRPGCIIHWEAKKGPRGYHEHLGFCVDATHAMSNSARTRAIETHHISYGFKKDGAPRRRALAYYWHKNLER